MRFFSPPFPLSPATSFTYIVAPPPLPTLPTASPWHAFLRLLRSCCVFVMRQIKENPSSKERPSGARGELEGKKKIEQTKKTHTHTCRAHCWQMSEREKISLRIQMPCFCLLPSAPVFAVWCSITHGRHVCTGVLCVLSCVELSGCVYVCVCVCFFSSPFLLICSPSLAKWGATQFECKHQSFKHTASNR